MHSISPHQNHHHMANMGSFGLALQQMRSNVGNTMGGYPSLSNPMNNGNESMPNMKNVLMPSLHSPMDTQTSMISEITPKKRGRKKKVRSEDGYVFHMNYTYLHTHTINVHTRNRNFIDFCFDTNRILPRALLNFMLKQNSEKKKTKPK